MPTLKKDVLGLVCSPRTLGNCEVFIKEISNNIPFEHTLHLIRVPSLNILPCRGCYGCIMGGPCPNHDDMDFLLENICRSDAIIMASPIYNLGTYSAVKNVLDRGFLFFRYIKRTFGKPAILVNTYGMREKIGVAPQTLLTFALFLGLTVKASVNVKAALPGEIILSKKGREQAKMLAKKLFSEQRTGNVSGCPFCGCEIVRMKGRSFICTLCHGTFSIDQEGNPLKIKECGTFGTQESMFRHREWLRGMKTKFAAKKREIFRATLPYKEVGQWITPDKPSEK